MLFPTQKSRRTRTSTYWVDSLWPKVQCCCFAAEGLESSSRFFYRLNKGKIWGYCGMNLNRGSAQFTQCNVWFFTTLTIPTIILRILSHCFYSKFIIVNGSFGTETVDMKYFFLYKEIVYLTFIFLIENSLNHYICV